MAKPLKIAGKVTLKDMAVVKFLTWLLKEIKAELKELGDEDVRLLGIKHELKKVLKLYKIVR